MSFPINTLSKTSFYSDSELQQLGLRRIGTEVRISRLACFYSPGTISVGDCVRIDDFCILSGSIDIGSYVHVSAYVALYGGAGIRLGDFSGLSPRVTLLSVSDDFGGEFLANAACPAEFRNVKSGPIVIERYVQVGAGTIVLPNSIIAEGSVTGALSLVKGSLGSWGVYAGIPVRRLRARGKGLVELAGRLQAGSE